jgi:hypothetical protein
MIVRVMCRYVCRSCKAVAIDDKQRLDIVRYASSHSDPMFNNFRDEGMFIGSDAYNVLFVHPDRGQLSNRLYSDSVIKHLCWHETGLRGALKQQNIISEGHIIDMRALDKLLPELFRRGYCDKYVLLTGF